MSESMAFDISTVLKMVADGHSTTGIKYALGELMLARLLELLRHSSPGGSSSASKQRRPNRRRRPSRE